MIRISISMLTGLMIMVGAACAQPAPAPQPDAVVDEEMTAGDITAAPRAVPESMGQVKLSFAPIVERASPAVVNIFTRRVVEQRSDPFFDRFFGNGRPRKREQSSLGSGVIVNPDGVIVTNNHVIENMTEITVVLSDRREYNAEVVLTDPQTDLAVLRIEADEALPYLTFSNSDALQVGDIVLAIGNPFGVGQTVTNGIVSALARTAASVSDYQLFIQTDAAINPGNSGGALVDTEGRLVGVNTAIYSRSGGSNGIGFAVPSRLVQQVLKTAIDGGVLVRPWLGVSTSTVTSDLARALELDRPAGALIDDVWRGGPADLAGLQAGDVVIEIDEKPVFDEQTLQYRIGVKDDAEEADIVYLRGGKIRNATVAVALPPDEPGRDPRDLDGQHPLNGVTVDNLSPRYSEELGLDPLSRGVVVSNLGARTFAARRGLRPGHKILSVNGRPVDTSDELEREINRPETSWEIEVDTGGRVATWRVGR